MGIRRCEVLKWQLNARAVDKSCNDWEQRGYLFQFGFMHRWPRSSSIRVDASVRTHLSHHLAEKTNTKTQSRGKLSVSQRGRDQQVETLTQHPRNSQGSSPYPVRHRTRLGNHTAWADSPPFKKSLNISSHHCHIIKQPIPAAEQARGVMRTTCPVSFLLLTLPITLPNGSPGTIRQHGPCSEVTPGRACATAG